MPKDSIQQSGVGGALCLVVRMRERNPHLKPNLLTQNILKQDDAAFKTGARTCWDPGDSSNKETWFRMKRRKRTRQIGRNLKSEIYGHKRRFEEIMPIMRFEVRVSSRSLKIFERPRAFLRSFHEPETLTKSDKHFPLVRMMKKPFQKSLPRFERKQEIELNISSQGLCTLVRTDGSIPVMSFSFRCKAPLASKSQKSESPMSMGVVSFSAQVCRILSKRRQLNSVG